MSIKKFGLVLAYISFIDLYASHNELSAATTAGFISEIDQSYFRTHPSSSAQGLITDFNTWYENPVTPQPEFNLDGLSRRGRVVFFRSLLERKYTNSRDAIEACGFNVEDKAFENDFFERKIIGGNRVRYEDKKPLVFTFVGQNYTLKSAVARDQRGNFFLKRGESDMRYDSLSATFATQESKRSAMKAIKASKKGTSAYDTIKEFLAADSTLDSLGVKIRAIDSLSILFDLEVARRYIDSAGSKDVALKGIPFGLLFSLAQSIDDFCAGESPIVGANRLNPSKALVKRALQDYYGGSDESESDS